MIFFQKKCVKLPRAKLDYFCITAIVYLGIILTILYLFINGILPFHIFVFVRKVYTFAH